MNGRLVVSDGCALAWRLDGPLDAPVLLLAHSLGASIDMWAPQVTRLGDRFRLLRYDSRGHGRSDAPDGDYSIDRLGRDAVELLDGLGIGRAHVCGLSMGGMVGMWLGVHAPERVGRLVLSNTSPYMGPPANWTARIEAVRATGVGGLVDGIVERWFTPAFRAAQPDVVAAVAATIASTARQGYAGCCAAIRDMDQRGDLARIAAPALVIGSRHDPGIAAEATQALGQAIPGSRLAMLDAAHLSNVEQPDVFSDAVAAFLA